MRQAWRLGIRSARLVTRISGEGTVELGGRSLRKMGVLVKNEGRRERRRTEHRRTVEMRARVREVRDVDGEREKVGTGGRDMEGGMKGRPELQTTPEEIQRAVDEIDQETFLRTEMLF